MYSQINEWNTTVHEQKIVFDSCCIHIRNDNYAYCKYRVTTTIRVVCIKCTVNIHMFAPCLLCCILQGEHNTPYPIVQVTQEDWKSTFEGRSSCSLKVDRVEVCEGMKVEEAMISSFYSYFVFNLEYQPKNKNTLTFLQRCIAKMPSKITMSFFPQLERNCFLRKTFLDFSSNNGVHWLPSFLSPNQCSFKSLWSV